MPDDTQNSGGQDRSRINVHQDHELRYWTKKFGVSREELEAAVQKVGTSAEAVAAQLGKQDRASGI